MSCLLLYANISSLLVALLISAFIDNASLLLSNHQCAADFSAIQRGYTILLGTSLTVPTLVVALTTYLVVASF